MVTETPIICPVPPPHGPGAPFTPCDPSEIEPLLAHLATNTAVAEPTAFPRGTVMPDGRLDLCKQSVGPDGCRAILSALSENIQIRSLLLGTDGIGDSGAEAVAQLVQRSRALSTVYLGCNRIGPEGTARLADAIADSETVTGLWLKRNPIGDGGASALAAMLRVNRSLRVLDMVNVGIGAAGLEAILAALTESNRTVERLYLGGNGLTGASAVLLARLLQANPTIKALLLSVNHLGDEGAKILAEVLYQNTTLTELDLASNGIGATGLAALLDATATHPTLTELDLGYSRSTRVLGSRRNRFDSPEGLAAITAFLRKNTPLRYLNLHGTRLSAHSDALADALESNTHLIDLRLDGTPDPRIAALLMRNRENTSILPRPAEVTQIHSVYR